jgi:C4-dicarboxylate-specific signal transduction histidine kinase
MLLSETGQGIEASRLDEIFEAFVTTKKKGMGLGLVICAGLLKVLVGN